jgi:hypothetical protein
MSRSAPVAVDVSAFTLVSAIDTCAIWNLLSSPRLSSAALTKGCWFAVARYVQYEALEKPRSRPSPADLALQQELRDRLQKLRGFKLDPMSYARKLVTA